MDDKAGLHINERTPRLSIITVCRNASATIERTLRSVSEQSFSDYEHLIIDGASTDNTLELVAQRATEKTQVVSEPDSGIYFAMNKGIRMARGEYCLFLNADDYLLGPSALTKVFSTMTAADFVYGDILVDYGRRKSRVKSPERMGPYELYKVMLCHQSQLIRRSLFDRIGLYDESMRISADYEFVLRAAFRDGVSFFHLPLVFSVFSANSASHTVESTELCLREKKIACERHFDQHHLELLTDLEALNNLLGVKVYRVFPRFARFERSTVVKLSRLLGFRRD